MAAAGKRRGTISEDDLSPLLHRYSPATILTLLQEVSQHAAAKLDWKAIVRRSSTGIACAREYQMLWRHLAYRDALLDRVDPAAEPLDDESDLEYEVEAVPAPSEEALSDATICAKGLISGSPQEAAPIHRATTEAPSCQNIPNDKIVRVPSDKQLARNPRFANFTVPVTDTKQMLQTGTTPDPSDANGPPKKKRKPWTKEEDMELTTAVQKYGEGNWLEILNGGYKHERTPVQLSQRWAAICKRQGLVKLTHTKPSSLAISEERKAAQKAFSMALDMPMTGVSSSKSVAPLQIVQHTPAFGAIMPEVKPITAPIPMRVQVPSPMQPALPAAPAPALPLPLAAAPPPPPTPSLLPRLTLAPAPPLAQIQQASAQAASPNVSSTSKKSRSNSRKKAGETSPAVSIQAAAIAAGGRIATASTAADLLKAAQSKNVVRIRSRGTGPSKSVKKSKTSNAASEHRAQPASAGHIEPSITSSPAASPSVLATHGTQQVYGVSGVAVVNPSVYSAAAHLLEIQQVSSTAPIHGSHQSIEKDNNTEITDITIEDLFPEDFKDAVMIDSKDAVMIRSKDEDMLEFDRFVAQGSRLNLNFLGNDNTDKDASKAQAATPGHEDQPEPKKLQSFRHSNKVLAGALIAEKKTIAPVPNGDRTSTLTETCNNAGGTGIAGVQNQTADVKRDIPAIAGNRSTAPEEQSEVPKDNGMSGNVEVVAEPPMKSQGDAVVNGGGNTNA